VFFLLNTSFEKAIDTPIHSRSNLLKNSLKHPVTHRNAVRRLIEKFRATGSALDGKRSGRPSTLNDKQLMDISDSVLRNPSKSLRELTQEKEIGLATAHKAV
jgi:transposase